MSFPEVVSLSGFTSGVRRAFPFLQALSASPLSANRILSTLRGAGLGVNRAQGLSVIRGVRAQLRALQTIRELPTNIAPSADLIPPPMRKQTTPFRHVVKSTLFNLETGQVGPTYVTVDSDFPIPYDEIVGRVQGLLLQYGIWDPETALSTELVEITQVKSASL